MEIIKSIRRSLVITVTEKGEVIVKAPFFVSNKEIDSFVQLKSNWIQKQQEKILKKEEIFSKFNFKDNVYIHGISYNWETIKNGNKKITKSLFYTKRFYEFLEIRAENFSKNSIKKPIFKLCNSKCIWGSCNTKNIIKLNWKLIILPENIQDYVIIHELSHLKEMNHSVNFWKNVEKFDPNYKKNRNELKKYSFLLKTNILED